MRTHAKYRLQVKNDKILTGLDEIRCSNKDTISVTMRWARVWAGINTRVGYINTTINRGGSFQFIMISQIFHCID